MTDFYSVNPDVVYFPLAIVIGLFLMILEGLICFVLAPWLEDA